MPGRHRQDYTPYDGPPEDREAYIRDNAVVVANDLTAKVRRQAKQITKLEHRTVRHRKLIRELRELVGIFAPSPPTASGYYWWREGGASPAALVDVKETNGRMFGFCLARHIPPGWVENWAGEWCPCRPPSGP